MGFRIVMMALLAATAALPAQASAKIVDLHCKFLPPSEAETMKFRLDDAAQTASWESTGGPQTRRAIFTTDTVSFASFKIDRMSLKLSRTNNDLFVEALKLPPIEYAQCSVVVTKAQF